MQDLYFKVILPSVAYGLKLWGSCYNSNLFQSVERLYCRAARLIFNLPKDMASAEVLQRAQWPTLSIYHKSAIFICFHKASHDRLPVTLIDLISKEAGHKLFNPDTRFFNSSTLQHALHERLCRV